MQHNKSIRVTALFTVFTFVLTNNWMVPTARAEVVRTESAQIQPLNVASLKLPAQFGEVVESAKGTTDQSVIIIQDAHSIPDAQKNIANLIKYFETSYGVNRVALEGASGGLDPQIFKSFPDKKLLREVFKTYFDAGELAGGTAAAIFGDAPAEYVGVEDWNKYQDGLALYLAAMEKQPEINEKLRVKSDELRAEKEKAYPKELLEVDRVVEKFYGNMGEVTELVKVLGSIQAPQVGSELEAVWKEVQKQTADHRPKTADKDIEVREISQTVERVLQSRSAELKIFNAKKQEWMTGQLSAEAFGMYLKETAEKLNLQIEMSSELLGMVREQQTLKGIEGTKFFRDLESYIQSVKSKLIREKGIEELNHQTEALRLLTKLSKLELSREDWKQVKAGGQSPEDRGSLWSSVVSLLSYHMAFYANAEERDQIFFDNLTSPASGPRATILVAGGFHAEGVTSRLKEAGIGYALVMPKINKLPEHSAYQAQMRGEVSWKDYFEVENGRINLYKAFVRATRDRLLAKGTDPNAGSGTGSVPNVQMLKSWRDQIIRDLADQNEIERAAQYTRYIDEILDPSNAPRTTNHDRLMVKIDKFIDGLFGLEKQNQLNATNIAQLLKATAASTLVAGVAPLSGVPARAELLEVAREERRVLPARAEERTLQNIYDAFAAFLGWGKDNKIEPNFYPLAVELGRFDRISDQEAVKITFKHDKPADSIELYITNDSLVFFGEELAPMGNVPMKDVKGIFWDQSFETHKLKIVFQDKKTEEKYNQSINVRRFFSNRVELDFTNFDRAINNLLSMIPIIPLRDTQIHKIQRDYYFSDRQLLESGFSSIYLHIPDPRGGERSLKIRYRVSGVDGDLMSDEMVVGMQWRPLKHDHNLIIQVLDIETEGRHATLAIYRDNVPFEETPDGRNRALAANIAKVRGITGIEVTNTFRDTLKRLGLREGDVVVTADRVYVVIKSGAPSVKVAVYDKQGNFLEIKDMDSDGSTKLIGDGSEFYTRVKDLNMIKNGILNALNVLNSSFLGLIPISSPLAKAFKRKFKDLQTADKVNEAIEEALRELNKVKHPKSEWVNIQLRQAQGQLGRVHRAENRKEGGELPLLLEVAALFGVVASLFYSIALFAPAEASLKPMAFASKEWLMMGVWLTLGAFPFLMLHGVIKGIKGLFASQKEGAASRKSQSRVLNAIEGAGKYISEYVRGGTGLARAWIKLASLRLQGWWLSEKIRMMGDDNFQSRSGLEGARKDTRRAETRIYAWFGRGDEALQARRGEIDRIKSQTAKIRDALEPSVQSDALLSYKGQLSSEADAIDLILKNNAVVRLTDKSQPTVDEASLLGILKPLVRFDLPENFLAGVVDEKIKRDNWKEELGKVNRDLIDGEKTDTVSILLKKLTNYVNGYAASRDRAGPSGTAFITQEYRAILKTMIEAVQASGFPIDQGVWDAALTAIANAAPQSEKIERAVSLFVGEMIKATMLDDSITRMESAERAANQFSESLGGMLIFSDTFNAHQVVITTVVDALKARVIDTVINGKDPLEEVLRRITPQEDTAGELERLQKISRHGRFSFNLGMVTAILGAALTFAQFWIAIPFFSPAVMVLAVVALVGLGYAYHLQDKLKDAEKQGLRIRDLERLKLSSMLLKGQVETGESFVKAQYSIREFEYPIDLMIQQIKKMSLDDATLHPKDAEYLSTLLNDQLPKLLSKWTNADSNNLIDKIRVLVTPSQEMPSLGQRELFIHALRELKKLAAPRAEARGVFDSSVPALILPSEMLADNQNVSDLQILSLALAVQNQLLGVIAGLGNADEVRANFPNLVIDMLESIFGVEKGTFNPLSESVKKAVYVTDQNGDILFKFGSVYKTTLLKLDSAGVWSVPFEVEFDESNQAMIGRAEDLFRDLKILMIPHLNLLDALQERDELYTVYRVFSGREYMLEDGARLKNEEEKVMTLPSRLYRLRSGLSLALHARMIKDIVRLVATLKSQIIQKLNPGDRLERGDILLEDARPHHLYVVSEVDDSNAVVMGLRQISGVDSVLSRPDRIPLTQIKEFRAYRLSIKPRAERRLTFIEAKDLAEKAKAYAMVYAYKELAQTKGWDPNNIDLFNAIAMDPQHPNHNELIYSMAFDFVVNDQNQKVGVKIIAQPYTTSSLTRADSIEELTDAEDFQIGFNDDGELAFYMVKDEGMQSNHVVIPALREIYTASDAANAEPQGEGNLVVTSSNVISEGEREGEKVLWRKLNYSTDTGKPHSFRYIITPQDILSGREIVPLQYRNFYRNTTGLVFPSTPRAESRAEIRYAKEALTITLTDFGDEKESDITAERIIKLIKEKMTSGEETDQASVMDSAEAVIDVNTREPIVVSVKGKTSLGKFVDEVVLALKQQGVANFNQVKQMNFVFHRAEMRGISIKEESRVLFSQNGVPNPFNYTTTEVLKVASDLFAELNRQAAKPGIVTLSTGPDLGFVIMNIAKSTVEGIRYSTQYGRNDWIVSADAINPLRGFLGIVTATVNDGDRPIWGNGRDRISIEKQKRVLIGSESDGSVGDKTFSVDDVQFSANSYLGALSSAKAGKPVTLSNHFSAGPSLMKLARRDNQDIVLSTRYNTWKVPADAVAKLTDFFNQVILTLPRAEARKFTKTAAVELLLSVLRATQMEGGEDFAAKGQALLEVWAKANRADMNNLLLQLKGASAYSDTIKQADDRPVIREMLNQILIKLKWREAVDALSEVQLESIADRTMQDTDMHGRVSTQAIDVVAIARTVLRDATTPLPSASNLENESQARSMLIKRLTEVGLEHQVYKTSSESYYVWGKKHWSQSMDMRELKRRLNRNLDDFKIEKRRLMKASTSGEGRTADIDLNINRSQRLLDLLKRGAPIYFAKDWDQFETMAGNDVGHWDSLPNNQTGILVASGAEGFGFYNTGAPYRELLTSEGTVTAPVNFPVERSVQAAADLPRPIEFLQDFREVLHSLWQGLGALMSELLNEYSRAALSVDITTRVIFPFIFTAISVFFIFASLVWGLLLSVQIVLTIPALAWNLFSKNKIAIWLDDYSGIGWSEFSEKWFSRATSDMGSPKSSPRSEVRVGDDSMVKTWSEIIAGKPVQGRWKQVQILGDPFGNQRAIFEARVGAYKSKADLETKLAEFFTKEGSKTAERANLVAALGDDFDKGTQFKGQENYTLNDLMEILLKRASEMQSTGKKEHLTNEHLRKLREEIYPSILFLFSDKERKITGVSYVFHLLGVTMLAMENKESSDVIESVDATQDLSARPDWVFDQIVASFHHDTLEDVLKTSAEIDLVDAYVSRPAIDRINNLTKIKIELIAEAEAELEERGLTGDALNQALKVLKDMIDTQVNEANYLQLRRGRKSLPTKYADVVYNFREAVYTASLPGANQAKAQKFLVKFATKILKEGGFIAELANHLDLPQNETWFKLLKKRFFSQLAIQIERAGQISPDFAKEFSGLLNGSITDNLSKIARSETRTSEDYIVKAIVQDASEDKWAEVVRSVANLKESISKGGTLSRSNVNQLVDVMEKAAHAKRGQKWLALFGVAELLPGKVTPSHINKLIEIMLIAQSRDGGDMASSIAEVITPFGRKAVPTLMKAMETEVENKRWANVMQLGYTLAGLVQPQEIARLRELETIVNQSQSSTLRDLAQDGLDYAIHNRPMGTRFAKEIAGDIAQLFSKAAKKPKQKAALIEQSKKLISEIEELGKAHRLAIFADALRAAARDLAIGNAPAVSVFNTAEDIQKITAYIASNTALAQTSLAKGNRIQPIILSGDETELEVQSIVTALLANGTGLARVVVQVPNKKAVQRYDKLFQPLRVDGRAVQVGNENIAVMVGTVNKGEVAAAISLREISDKLDLGKLFGLGTEKGAVVDVLARPAYIQTLLLAAQMISDEMLANPELTLKAAAEIVSGKLNIPNAIRYENGRLTMMPSVIVTLIQQMRAEERAGKSA